MSGLMFMDAPYQDGQGWYRGLRAGRAESRSSGFLPPTSTVKDELKTVIAGVEINLIPRSRRDAGCHPRLAAAKAVLMEIGVHVRRLSGSDDHAWQRPAKSTGLREQLKIARSLIRLPGGDPWRLPVTVGEENVRQYLTNFSDAIQFMHDQTVQYMNKDYAAGEIIDLMQMPAHLASNDYLQETYGGRTGIFPHLPLLPGLLHRQVRDLFPQSPLSEAMLSAELAGGVGALAVKAQRPWRRTSWNGR